MKINANNRQQLLAMIAIGIVALFVADKIIITPLGEVWSSRSKRIAELRVQVTDGSSLLNNEQRIRSRWELMQTNTLPENMSMAEQKVVGALYAWGQETRVNVNGVMPQWKQDSDEFRTLECRVDAQGNLETLSRYLYAIEKDPMALKLQSVELSAHDNEGQVLTLGLQVSGLVLIPKAQQPPSKR